MKKKILCVGIVILAFASLTGCDKDKKMDYSVSTQEVEEHSGDNSIGGQELSDEGTKTGISEEGMPQHITYDVTGKNVTVAVDADVILPNSINYCPVVELSRREFNNEDVKNYADMIFDEGSYFLYMPYSEEQIEFLRNKFQNIINETTDDELKLNIENNYLMDLDFKEELLDSFDVYIDGEIKFYSVPVVDDVYANECKLIGTIDGEYYMLSIGDDGSNSYLSLDKMNLMYAPEDIDPKNFEELSMNNTCSYSMEEAQALAEDYLSKLGLDDLSVVRINHVNRWSLDSSTMDEEEQINGYCIYFGRKYGGYNMVYADHNFYSAYGAYDIDEETQEYIPMQGEEFASVYVDDDGIALISVGNPLEEKNTLTDQPVMLSFDSVDQIAQTTMKDYADRGDFAVEIDEIELGYASVKQDGQITLVPAWYYFTYLDSEKYGLYLRNACIVINALDGSVIRSN